MCIDCGSNTCEIRKLGERKCLLHVSSEGHYLLPMSDFNPRNPNWKTLTEDQRLKPKIDSDDVRMFEVRSGVAVGKGSRTRKCTSALISHGLASSPSGGSADPLRARCLRDQFDGDAGGGRVAVGGGCQHDIDAPKASPSRGVEHRQLRQRPKQKSQSNQAAASIPEEEPGQKVKSKKVSTKSKPKQQQLAATTGQLADFPLLGMTKSYDPVFNASWIVHQRMICHKWKALVWMLKVRAAMGLSKMQWRRNPRWLANLYAQELAKLWGHVGVWQSDPGNTGPPLFRAA